MIRGTTAQFKFKLPYSYSELEWITIDFWQPGNPSGNLPITKTKTHCDGSSQDEVCVSLSAAETAYFSDKYKAKVQLRAKPKVGAAFGSKQQLITVYPMYNIAGDGPDDGYVTLDGGSITDTEGGQTVINGGSIT